MAPLHPEITYAERSSASEPEKVSFSLLLSQLDSSYGLELRLTFESYLAR